MGCAESIPNRTTDQSDAPETLSRQMLTEEIKQLVIDTIQSDNLAQAAVLDMEYNIDANAQLSDEGLYWMATHFCCRWQAPKILEYILKQYYVFSPRSYIKFVNQRTSDGHTVLHLCAIWGSDKCLALLFQYGGLDLQAKDKMNKDPLQTARDYRRSKMVNLLQRYQQANIDFTHVEHTKLLSGSILNLNEQKSYEMPMSESLPKLVYNILNYAEELKKIEENKQRIEREQQTIRQKRMKQEEEMRKRKDQLQKQKKVEQIDEITRLFKQNDAKLQHDLQKRDQEISAMNKQLKIIQQLKIRYKKQQENTMMALKIRENKFRVEQEKQALRQKRMRQEKQMHRRQIQVRKRQHQLQQQQIDEQVCQIARLFEQNDSKFQDELKKKYQEIEAMNKQLKRIQQQKIQQKIEQENALIVQSNLEVQVQNQKRIAEKKNQINAIYLIVKGTLDVKKQKIKQNDFDYGIQREIKKRENMKKQVHGICPQNFKKLYEQAKQKGIFTDAQFPADSETIGKTNGKKADKTKKLTANLAWLRPNQFLRGGDYELFDGINPNDIKQGSLGVCYFLATLSVMAKYPETIKKIFHFYDKTLGFYVLRLYRDGMQHFLVLDDLIPCSKKLKSPLFTKPIGNQIWVILLEKAWAKSIGNYIDAEAMTPDHMMEDFSGSPSFGLWLNQNPQERIQEINMHDDLNHLIVLTSVADKKIEGISNNHAYSMLKSHKHNGTRIYQVRNPWGHFQWKGMYGQKQAIWTQQLKKKVGFKDGDDGLFYCSQDEILQCFCYYSVSMIKPNFKYNFLPMKSAKNEIQYFGFRLDKDTEINLRVTQKFKRMIQDQKYEYSPLVFETWKFLDDRSVTMLDSGSKFRLWGAKSVHSHDKIMRVLSKGKYFLAISFQWKFPEQYNQAVIVSYAQKDVQITKLDQNQGKQLWFKTMISKGKQTAKKVNGKIVYGIKRLKQCDLFYVQTQSEEPVQAKFVFKSDQLNNLKVGYNGVDEKTLQIEVRKGKPNIGTLTKIDMRQGVDFGSFFIQT